MTSANSNARTLLLIAGVLGLTGVLAGTFGAHGLKERLSPEMLTVFETGVRYHLIHAVALLAIGLHTIHGDGIPRFAAAAWMFIVGVVLFSGSLYLLAISGQRWLGWITPFGGACFILGWLSICRVALRIKTQD